MDLSWMKPTPRGESSGAPGESECGGVGREKHPGGDKRRREES